MTAGTFSPHRYIELGQLCDAESAYLRAIPYAPR
jgi:hypothetical protein